MARVEYLHRNSSGGGSVHRTLEAAEEAQQQYLKRKEEEPRWGDEPLPHTEDAGIWIREVTDWVRYS